MEGSFSRRLGGCFVSVVGFWLRDGRGQEGGDLKDSAAVAAIDFSLSDPLA